MAVCLQAQRTPQCWNLAQQASTATAHPNWIFVAARARKSGSKAAGGSPSDLLAFDWQLLVLICVATLLVGYACRGLLSMTSSCPEPAIVLLSRWME